MVIIFTNHFPFATTGSFSKESKKPIVFAKWSQKSGSSCWKRLWRSPLAWPKSSYRDWIENGTISTRRTRNKVWKLHLQFWYISSLFVASSDEGTSKGSANSSHRNSDSDSDSSVRSLESVEKVLQRRNKMRDRDLTTDDETSDSDSDGNSKKRKKRHLRSRGNKRGKLDVMELCHYLPSYHPWFSP